VVHHPENAMESPFSGEKIFDELIIGFFPGNDPIFLKFKQIIGPHHFSHAMAGKTQHCCRFPH
jgi:hypothetical protein